MHLPMKLQNQLQMVITDYPNTHKFDSNGNETEIDYIRMFKIIKDAGFTGYVGIEYEGGLYNMFDPASGYLSSAEGIKATHALLGKVKKELIY